MNHKFWFLPHTNYTDQECKYTHNIPSPSLVSSSCQNADVNPARRVIVLQRTRQAVRPIFLLTTGWPASTPRGIAVIVKTRVNAGPARNSYSIPVAVYSHTHGTSELAEHLWGKQISLKLQFLSRAHCCMLKKINKEGESIVLYGICPYNSSLISSNFYDVVLLTLIRSWC